MQDTVRRLKAVADAQRLLILGLIADKGECAVSEIQDVLEISPSAASRALRTLEEAGWLQRRRDHRWILYRIQPTAVDVQEMLPVLRRLVENDPDLVRAKRALTTRRSMRQDSDDEPPLNPVYDLNAGEPTTSATNGNNGAGVQHVAPAQPSASAKAAEKPAQPEDRDDKPHRRVLFEFGNQTLRRRRPRNGS